MFIHQSSWPHFTPIHRILKVIVLYPDHEGFGKQTLLTFLNCVNSNNHLLIYFFTLFNYEPYFSVLALFLDTYILKCYEILYYIRILLLILVSCRVKFFSFVYLLVTCHLTKYVAGWWWCVYLETSIFC